ncbi:hypothetical protein [Streptomyces antarcticus]|uniref:hypothetical protein n=1 Tax=Streptomyces antarcticus TaxID=2996458 RepID=UPI003B833FA5
MNHGGGAADTPAGYVDPAGPEVRAAEAARGATGPRTKAMLTPTATPLGLGGGRTVRSWAYGDSLPGREVRAEPDGPPLMAGTLRAAGSVTPAPPKPDRTVQIRLTGPENRYDWASTASRTRRASGTR